MAGGMSTYIPLIKPPRAWVSSTHTPEMLPTMTVHVAPDAPEATGLYDANGTPLYRTQHRNPIGFVKEPAA